MKYTLDYLINETLCGGGDSDKHLMFLYSMVIGSNAKNIIELGVRNGKTTVPLVLGAKKTGGMVHSVDKEPTRLILDEELIEFNKFYLQDVLEFLNKWDDSKKIDIVYIDDWHSYDHVKIELEILDKIVSPKTVILLHDTMYGETCPFYHTDLMLKDGQWANGSVYRAIAELNTQFWEFSTLPWGNGMTILRKKYSNKYKRK